MIVSFITTIVNRKKSLIEFRAEKVTASILDLRSRFHCDAIAGFPTTTSKTTLEAAARLGGFRDSWWISNPLDAKEADYVRYVDTSASKPYSIRRTAYQMTALSLSALFKKLCERLSALFAVL